MIQTAYSSPVQLVDEFNFSEKFMNVLVTVKHLDVAILRDLKLLCQVPNLAIREDFEHLIAHTLSCTLKFEDVSAIYRGLKFGSLDEVIKVEDLVYFDDCKVECQRRLARVG